MLILIDKVDVVLVSALKIGDPCRRFMVERLRAMLVLHGRELLDRRMLLYWRRRHSTLIIFLDALKAPVEALLQNLKIVLLILVEIVLFLSFAVSYRDLLLAFASWTVAAQFQAWRAQARSIREGSDLLCVGWAGRLFLYEVFYRLDCFGVFGFPFDFIIGFDAVDTIAWLIRMLMMERIRRGHGWALHTWGQKIVKNFCTLKATNFATLGH